MIYLSTEYRIQSCAGGPLCFARYAAQDSGKVEGEMNIAHDRSKLRKVSSS